MQDGASCHTAKSTCEWLKSNKINFIDDWPAQSPDLNPIEKVCKIIKDRIDFTNITSQQDLFERIKKEWSILTIKEIRNLISSLPRRIDAVVQQKGNNTKY